MTGNIIVSTCCLGDMAVNAPSSSGCALGHGGVYSHITLANMSYNYYLSVPKFDGKSTIEAICINS